VSTKKPKRPAVPKASTLVRPQQWLKNQVQELLVEHAPGTYARLRGLRRANDPTRTLGTDWEAPADGPNAASDLHAVLAEPALLMLERPEGLDAEFFRRAANPDNELLEQVVDVYQMRQTTASVCFIVPVLRNDAQALERTIQSVLRQTDPQWELLLCGADDVADELVRWLDIDWRVRRFTGAMPLDAAPFSKQAAIQATASFVGLLLQGDVVDDDLVKSIGKQLRTAPTTDLVYANGARRPTERSPEHRPEHLEPGLFVAIRKSLLLSLPTSQSGPPPAAEHDLLEALTQRARRVLHLDALLDVPDASPVDAAAADASSPEAYRQLLDRLDLAARTRAAQLGLDWNASMTEAPERHSATRQALTLLQRGLFDADWYLATYPDVKAAGFEPIVHYVNLGDAEGRRPNAYFDPDFYRDQFGATRVRSVTALYHYALIGEAIGLKASRTFSSHGYLASNAALRPWLDQPLTHFLHLGRQGGLMANYRPRLSASQKIRFARAALPRSPGQFDLDTGINIIGPLDRVSGLGVSARGYLDGLRRAGFTQVGCQAQQREFAIQKSASSLPTFPPWLPDARINLVHMNGDTLPVMIKAHGDGFLQGRYNIAVWYWELPTLRPEWQATMKNFHEFWAATPFIARALQQSTAKPVRLVPPYLAYLANLKTDTHTATAQSHFVYCFDANSILERKNPGVLLDAFLQAFPASDSDTRLTFKVTYPNRAIADVDRLYRAAASDPRIQVIDRMLSDADLYALIGSATAYVSPHRSEGLGLTVIEAMGAGVPVISTPFGGVDAFVSPDAAFPIGHRYAELPDDYPPYPQGFVWADPDVQSLSDQLVLVHRDRSQATARAHVARERVLNYFCAPSLLTTYRSEFDRIARL